LQSEWNWIYLDLVMGDLRPKLKSVVAVLLLWQFAASVLAGVPAFAQSRGVISGAVAVPHCPDHGATGDGTASAQTSGDHSAANHHHVPGCCHDVHSCHCTGAQGVAAIAQAVTPDPADAGPAAESDLRTPPPLRWTADLFRPPI
jgi:hypothetical protein